MEDLLGGAGAEFADGVPLDGSALGALACDSVLHRVLMAGRSVILDYGTGTGTISANLFNALVVRDHHCRFPDCDRPASWCEAHHVVHVADGATPARRTSSSIKTPPSHQWRGAGAPARFGRRRRLEAITVAAVYSGRAQRKALKVARPHLVSASEPIAYAFAVGGPPPLWTLVLVLAGAVIIAVVTNGAIIPGWLVMMLVFWAVNRPLGVVVTSHDVSVMKRNRLTGRPKPPVTMAPHATFEMPTRSSGPWKGFSVDSSVVWMTTKQADRTVNALPREGRTAS